MAETQIPLIKGDKVSIETDYRDALPVNMYAVPKPIMRAAGYMLCYPGLTAYSTGNGIDRGAFYNDRFSEHYRVSGEALIKVSSDGSVTNLGAVPGLKQASMPYSFQTQCVIANGNMFLYSPSGGFIQVTDADLGKPLDAVWVDGYYFLTDGEYIYHTDIADETSIDPLKFATAEFMPDKSLAVAKTQDNKVLVFGRYSLEYFVDQANENFAFTRIETRAQKIGIVATHAKCEFDGTFFIVGSRRNESLGVHQIGVGQSLKVSTREIDKLLAQYTEPELADIRMECRTEDGSSFIIIHLPNETIYFSPLVAQKMGAELAWGYLQTGSDDQSYRGINGVFDQDLGKWVYGDKYNSNIGILDNTVFSQYGDQQEWYLFTPMVNMETMSIDELEIETIPGNTAFDDATVAVSMTYDGLNYSTEEWEMYGEPLDRAKRFILYRLGYVDNWVGFRFRSVTKSRMAFSDMVLSYG